MPLVGGAGPGPCVLSPSPQPGPGRGGVETVEEGVNGRRVGLFWLCTPMAVSLV